MPQFAYSALDRQGQAVTGELRADSRQAAIAQLAESGRFVTQIDADGAAGRVAGSRKAPPAAGNGSVGRARASGETGASGRVSLPWRWRKTLTARQRASLLNQLAIALQAGLPLMNALRVVQEQADH